MAEEQPETSFVASYTDYLKVRNKADNDDDEAYVVPDDQLTVIDYLVGYQLVQEIEPSLQPIFQRLFRCATGSCHVQPQQSAGAGLRGQD